MRPAFLSVLLLAGLAVARANPTGGTVAAGQASIATRSGTVVVTQATDKAIINWSDFNIAKGETTRFVQPDALSSVLNRVTGGNPTAIHGALQANGRVFVLNPNGVLVGPEGRIDTAGFLAGTHRLADGDFLRGGALRFEDGGRADVVNLGTIQAAGGDIVLLGRTVKNQGSLAAAKGAVRLGAGEEVLLAPDGDDRLVINTGSRLAVQGVDHTGTITAAAAELQGAGGNAYALAVNSSGVIHVTGVEQRGGRILLTAAGGNVAVAGNLQAARADGSGGEILVGGDYQGKNAAVANAATVAVADSATLTADAATAGEGGRVIVWSDLGTRFLGQISARGGSVAGNGGFAEVSGKARLDFRGAADLRAPAGRAGLLLLDPSDLTISAAADSAAIDNSGGFISSPTGAASNLSVATLQAQLALSDVFITTDSVQAGGGDITVADPVAWSSANMLLLLADRDIAVNADVTGANGSLVLVGRHATSSAAATIDVDTLSVSPRFDGSTATFNGVVKANTLSLGPASSIASFGDVLATNAGNRFGALQFDYDNSVTLNGNLSVYDGAGGLTVSGTPGAQSGDVTIRTVGDLTLNLTSAFGATGAVALEAAGGNFINATAFAPFPNAAKFLIYSSDPATIQKGGLAGDKRYNATFATVAPATIAGSGGHFLYSVAPVLTFAAANAGKTYGAPNPAFTFSLSGGLIDGDTAPDAYTGAPAFGSVGVNTGTHAITGAAGSLVSPLGYQFAFTPGTFTIDPAALTIGAQAASRTYGAANPSFAATFSGLVNGDTESVVSGLGFTTAATVGSPVGNYAVTPAGGSAANYTIAYAPGQLTVNPAPLTIAADDAVRLYGATNPSFAAIFSGLVNGDTESVVSGLGFATVATVGSPVGNYAVTPAGGSATNYTIAYAPGQLTVNPAPLTIAADDKAKTFGAANPALTASYSGFVNGETESVVTGLNLTTAATTSSSAGSYPIIASGAVASNYFISYVAGNLVIDPAVLTLEVMVSNATRLYGAANPAFSATITGFQNGDTADVISGLTFATTATTASPVGSYPIVGSGGTASNYIINYTPGTLTVNPAPLTITAAAAARLYGATNPSFAAYFSGLVNGDTESVVSGLGFTTAATVGSPVGDYAVTPAGGSAANYTIAYVPGQLTVNPAPLTITADDKARPFGAANPALTANYSGFVNGETESIVTGLQLATPATASSGVGSYSITASGAVASNYFISYVAGNLVIDPAVLTLEVMVNNATRLYGAANPAFSAHITGFQNGDTVDVVAGLGFATTATTASPVGSYPIVASGGQASNYVFNYTPGLLLVTPAPLRITAANATRLYGAANPSFTAQFTGLLNGDTASVVSGLTFATSATARANVGSYAITPSGASASNYVISYQPGTLAVTPAPLTITAKDAVREATQANPPFAGTYTGLVNGDSPSVVSGLTYVTPATTTSAPGSYEIKPADGSAPNYTLTRVPGTLTVRALTSGSSVTQGLNDQALGSGQRSDTTLQSATNNPAAGTGITIVFIDQSTTAPAAQFSGKSATLWTGPEGRYSGPRDANGFALFDRKGRYIGPYYNGQPAYDANGQFRPEVGMINGLTRSAAELANAFNYASGWTRPGDGIYAVDYEAEDFNRDGYVDFFDTEDRERALARRGEPPFDPNTLVHNPQGIYGKLEQDLGSQSDEVKKMLDILQPDNVVKSWGTQLAALGFTSEEIALLASYRSENEFYGVIFQNGINDGDRSALRSLLREARERQEVETYAHQGPYGLPPETQPVINGLVAGISRDDIRDILYKKAFNDYLATPEGRIAQAKGNYVLPYDRYPSQADIDVYYNGLGKDSATDAIMLPYLFGKVQDIQSRRSAELMAQATGASTTATTTEAERALLNYVETYMQMKLQKAAEGMAAQYLVWAASDGGVNGRPDEDYAGLLTLYNLEPDGAKKYPPMDTSMENVLESAFFGSDSSNPGASSMSFAALNVLGGSAATSMTGGAITAYAPGIAQVGNKVLPFMAETKNVLSGARTMGGPVGFIIGTAVGMLIEFATQVDWNGDPGAAVLDNLQNMNHNPPSLNEITRQEGGDALLWAALSSMMGDAGDPNPARL